MSVECRKEEEEEFRFTFMKWSEDEYINRFLCGRVQTDIRCEECTHIFKYADDIKICILCNMEEIELVKDSEDKNPQCHMKYWRRDHDRGRWTNEILSKLKGEGEQDIFSVHIWYGIISLVPETFTWKLVYDAFKISGLEDQWLMFGWFVDLKPNLNEKVLTYTENYSNTFKGKYRFNYLYLLYKFTQLFGQEGDEMRIPIKISAYCLNKTDIEWKEICDRDKLKFIPSKVYHLKYDKSRILDQLIKSFKVKEVELPNYEIPYSYNSSVKYTKKEKKEKHLWI